MKKELKKSTPEGINGARKALYQRLCSERYCYYNDMFLAFEGINYKTPEILGLNIGIPVGKLGITPEEAQGIETYVEDYFLRQIAPIIKRFEADDASRDSQKDYVQSKLSIQNYDNKIRKKSCVHYHEGYVVVKCTCKMPLNGLNVVAGKKALRLITELLKELDSWMNQLELESYYIGKKVYLNQRRVREILKEKKGICFIKNGSILPGKLDEDEQVKAVPFVAPKEFEERFYMDDGEELVGMMIKQGVTAITGGAYSGKSTLLEAIHSGIYDHVMGDGREYVITDMSAVMICAEDGRGVNNTDISPFFQEQINGCHLEKFSTEHASGSTSQAVNVIEAMYGESKVLLMDEDRSATNFMHRDIVMRDIIEKEPIIPLTDRIREISTNMNVSMVLVIGGTSEYFGYADFVLLMDEYRPQDITERVRKFRFVDTSKETLADWTFRRNLVTYVEEGAICQCECTKDRQVVTMNGSVADLTNVGHTYSLAQLNLMAKIIRLLLETEERSELKADIDGILGKISEKERTQKMGLGLSEGYYEEVRRMDVLLCLFRMRGIKFR